MVDLKEVELYDLENDESETSNVANQHPDVVNKIKELANQKRSELGDSLRDMEGSERREPGMVKTE